MKQYEVPVLSNKQVSNRYWHMRVDISNVKETITPGQFFHIRCTSERSPFLRRPFSIYQIHDQSLEFLYLVKGVGTQRMTHISPGETLNLLGPLGEGFKLDPQAKTILLVARGVGVATLAAIAQQAFKQNVKVVAVLSARTREDLLAAEYLTEFGADVYPVTEEEGTSDVAYVNELLTTNILIQYKIDTVYTCGSRRLSKLTQQLADKYRIPGEIALEEHMGCAMGACYACVSDIIENGQKKSVRVCIDGPVFPLEKVMME